MRRSSLAIAVAAILFSLGTIGYQAREISRRRTSLVNEQKRLDRLERQLAEHKQQRDTAARELEIANRALVEASPKTATTTASPESTRASELNTWLARLKRLKQSFDDHPEQCIPEFQFL